MEPPDCNQAYGICFTESGEIALVLTYEDGAPYWNLVGGGVEEGESLEDALRREVMEEACAELIDCRYIGSQRIDDPEHPGGPQRYYQARFWARIRLLEWRPNHEIRELRLVAPAEFRSNLAWGSAPSAAWILEEGLRLDAMSQPQVQE